MSDERIENAIEAAIARGDFDDLPGAGKPLKLPSHDDPDWWVRQRLDDDDIDRDALLPPVVLLRREAEGLDASCQELPQEHQVREYLEDFNERVLADRARNPLARMLAPTVDVDERVERWRESRAAAPRPAPPEAPAARAGWLARVLRRG